MENERSIIKREKTRIRVRKFRAVQRLKAKLIVNNALDKLYEHVRHTQENSHQGKCIFTVLTL